MNFQSYDQLKCPNCSSDKMVPPTEWEHFPGDTWDEAIGSVCEDCDRFVVICPNCCDQDERLENINFGCTAFDETDPDDFDRLLKNFQLCRFYGLAAAVEITREQCVDHCDDIDQLTDVKRFYMMRPNYTKEQFELLLKIDWKGPNPNLLADIPEIFEYPHSKIGDNLYKISDKVYLAEYPITVIEGMEKRPINYYVGDKGLYNNLDLPMTGPDGGEGNYWLCERCDKIYGFSDK